MLTSWICFCVSFCAPAGSSLAGRWTRERRFPVTLPCLALCMSLAVIVGLTPGISRRFQSVGCGGARLGPEISTLSLAWTARPKHRYNYLCSSSVMLSDMSKTYRLSTHHTHMHNQAHGTCTHSPCAAFMASCFVSHWSPHSLPAIASDLPQETKSQLCIQI